MTYHALVPAAGWGSRMGALNSGATPKQYLPLAGQPMIRHALATLCASPAIADVFVVLAPDDTLWPAAQMAALPMLFGNGALLDGAAVLDWLGWVPAQQRDAIFGPAEFVLAEAVVVVAGLLAAGLAAAAVMQPGAPRIRLLLALVAAALALRSLAYAISFGPDQAFVWLTPGAIGGLMLGLLTLLVMAHGRPLAVHAAALAATAIWIGVVNLVPDNPYHLDWLAGFRPGRLAHFQAVAHWLSLAWPLVLAAALLALSAARGARR